MTSATDAAIAAALPVIYECPDCGELGVARRCPDCQLFTRRLGRGGRCSHCDELVTVADLADSMEPDEVPTG